ncbi:MAG: HI1506-related protein [Neptuniibacter sp.]
MSKHVIHAALVAICSAPSGYRRGGVELEQGPNLFEADRFSEEELQQLRDDPRLTLAEGEGEDAETESDPGNEKKGTVDPDRLAELVKHIEGLDKNDDSLWKQDNAGPKASAFPKGTTAEERDAAWDAYVKQLDAAK